MVLSAPVRCGARCVLALHGTTGLLPRHQAGGNHTVARAQVLAVSSAAAVFTLMSDVPPVTLAAWRLQLTSLLLLPGAVWQYVRLGPEGQRDWRASGAWLSGSGACLAAHFGLWVWSLQHTSLAHSVLFVATAPVIMTVAAVALRQPISRGEIGGTVLAMGGSVVLAVGAARGSEQQATLLGDLAAFGAAVAVVGYLIIGRRLRAWMPLFCYALPVTALAALLLSLGALAMGAAPLLGGADRHGLVGWAASPHYAPLVVYLAVGPGLVGHTGFNAVLRYLTPLTVGLATTLEPVIAPALGWLLGVMAPPALLTYLGGGVVFLATVAVTVATARREAAEAQRQRTAAHLTRVFSGQELGHLMGGGAEADDLEARGLLGSDSDDPPPESPYGGGGSRLLGGGERPPLSDAAVWGAQRELHARAHH